MIFVPSAVRESSPISPTFVIFPSEKLTAVVALIIKVPSSVIVLFVMIAPVSAQEFNYDTGHWEWNGSKDFGYTPQERGGSDKSSPEGQNGDPKAQAGEIDPERVLEILAFADGTFFCTESKNAPNTLAGKLKCLMGYLANKGIPNLPPIRDPQEVEIYTERLNLHRETALKEQFSYSPEYRLRIGVQVKSSEVGLTECSISAISIDGKPTNFRAANYDFAGTQKLVDDLRIIDPHSKIHFNERNVKEQTLKNRDER